MISHHSNRELWYSFFAMVVISLLYLWVTATLRAVPAASSFFGHMMGVLGFLLMLMTETLYSLRKRSRTARWGRMASWMQFHIFTGLVGPFLVLLHTSWKFNGLAGIVTLFTVIIVASGFVGRYIYTAVPRTVDGMEIEAAQIQDEIRRTQNEIDNWLTTRPAGIRTMAERLSLQARPSQGAWSFLIERPFSNWSTRLRWWQASQHLAPGVRAQFKQMESLLQRQQALRGQLNSVAMARRLLSIWHTVHIPIGMALFTAAFIHIGAAIYYATLLR